MKGILIISEYSNNENIKDGMIRRISEIDKKIEKEVKRIYLDISFRKNLKKEVRIEGNLEVYKVNFFKEYFFIKNEIKKNDTIYIHSLYNYLKIHFFNTKNKKIILDVHGIVPEEVEFLGNKFKSKVLNYFERKLFKKIKKIIFVTKQMENFYRKKYPENLWKIESHIFPIMENKGYNSKKKLTNLPANISNKTIVIYSGNIQKWQNIDLMIDIISKNLSKEIYYIILTGQKAEMINKIQEKRILEECYLVESVLPEELPNYYEIANYGFVLRDSHILNRVSNPTKLGEYLDYGIIPIVKLEEIGDYKKLGYEYITVDNFNTSLPKIKSKKNLEIMKKYREEVGKKDFYEFIKN